MSRRALVAGGVIAGIGSAGALTGCDAVDDVLGRKKTPAVSGEVTATAPPVDADGALVDEIVAAICAAGALATATGTAVPGLARISGRFTRIHEAHAKELGGSVDLPAPVVTGPRPAARAALLDHERTLQATLVSAAQRAESGALAQIFASMAAALAQQQAVLA